MDEIRVPSPEKPTGLVERHTQLTMALKDGLARAIDVKKLTDDLKNAPHRNLKRLPSELKAKMEAGLHDAFTKALESYLQDLAVSMAATLMVQAEVMQAHHVEVSLVDLLRDHYGITPA